ncbi:MAG: hypothetical protein WCR08_02875 [Gammaproteobacteria bacterium]
MIKHGYKAFFLKFDASLRYALGTRLWQTFASCLTLWLILHNTQPAEQGVFYTFTSLANLQIFFELGLSFVILQTTSHFFKDLSWGAHGAVLGLQADLDILWAFSQKALRIYVALACGFVLVMIPLGLGFFNEPAVSGSQGALIHLSWVLLVLGMAVNLLCAPLLAILEGSGKVMEIYRLRLRQLLMANILAWVVFYLTNVLFIIVVNTWITAATTVFWLLKTHRQFLLLLARSVFKPLPFSWRKEIWPMQWRIALSWMSGYILNQIFTPLLYHYQGAVISGQMGICLLLANMLGLFSITWVTIHSPKMGELVAQSNRKSLDEVFFAAFWQSVFIFILGATGILGLGWLLRGQDIITRFLPWLEMALLLLAFFFVHIIGVLSLYLRAHRIELFAPISVVGAGLIMATAWFGAVHYGSLGVTWSILIVNACYGFPSALWLWIKFKRKWRDDNERNNDESETYNQHSNVESS